MSAATKWKKRNEYSKKKGVSLVRAAPSLRQSWTIRGGNEILKKQSPTRIVFAFTYEGLDGLWSGVGVGDLKIFLILR